MDIDYRGITVEISSITGVTPQQATPSPRYYRKFHLQNRGIPAVTAVLPPSPLPCRALLWQHGMPSAEALTARDAISRGFDGMGCLQPRLWQHGMPSAEALKILLKHEELQLFTFCIRWGLVSSDSIDDGAWLPVTEWCQRYLPCYLFTVTGLLFFHVSPPAGTVAYLVYPISDVAENLGSFLVRSVQAVGMTLNWFER